MRVRPHAASSRAAGLIGRRQVIAGGTAALALAAGTRPSLAETLSPPGFAPSGYRLVFHDEFDDPDVGRINENATGGRPGAPAWRSRYHQDRFIVINQEKQIYMDPSVHGHSDHPLGVQPFSIEGGILTISANRADPVKVKPFIHNMGYTSGCITSELTHWQTYGYIEMRASLPVGRGFWPAFWLLPKKLHWPPEIDVFEGAGQRPRDLHAGVINAPNHAPGRWLDGVVDSVDQFHVYGLLWTRDTLTWMIDGKAVWQTPNQVNEDMYILANLALGSHDQNFIPDPDAGTPFPGRFRIDYIRAYQA
jgi:hypothetical protein